MPDATEEDLEWFADTLHLVLGAWAFGIGIRFLLSLTEAKILGVHFNIPPHAGNYVLDFGPLAILGATAVALNAKKIAEEHLQG